ncbi:pilus assembly PilX N-terminal domain-containing protein [Geothrix sp. 21YS21S-2]|uniref:pilus assembly PilX N-terminal domain-containing protein n=1 Tax=Geothrix sp. 21YS21S-2 TaxID=3068893 RepID=UPI0027B91D7B|nr:pilus assembly PilX N-terminal domain-containing protein [Geothrix sp. 21YS21S-2]
MRNDCERPSSNRETGGITILVALMLLVFITLTAVGMSRNSFREVVISGTTRQGALARNVADSGVEWSIYWMTLENAPYAAGPSAKLKDLKATLLATPSLSGRSWNVMSTDLTAPSIYNPQSATQAVTLDPITTSGGTTVTQGYAIGLTSMGKMLVTNMSQGLGSGAFAPATGNESKQAPDLWAVRSDARVGVGAVSFVHAKELWISTPVQ